MRKVVEARDEHHTARGLLHRTAAPVFAEDITLDIQVGLFIASAIYQHIAGTVRKDALVHAKLEGELAHELLARAVVSDEQSGQAVWRIMNRAFKVVDAGGAGKLMTDCLVKVALHAHIDR